MSSPRSFQTFSSFSVDLPEVSISGMWKLDSASVGWVLFQSNFSFYSGNSFYFLISRYTKVVIFKEFDGISYWYLNELASFNLSPLLLHRNLETFMFIANSSAFDYTLIRIFLTGCAEKHEGCVLYFFSVSLTPLYLCSEMISAPQSSYEKECV